MAATQLPEYLKLGKIGAAYGIKGWVKLISYADPADNILNYQSFIVKNGKELTILEIDQSRPQGKGFVGHIKGCDDRDNTRDYTGKELLIEKSTLPELSQDSYYWHQLEGLRVITESGDDLGKIDHLIETGANDVMVVKPEEASIDEQERLIPFLLDRIVTNIDLKAGLMTVNWERDY